MKKAVCCFLGHRTIEITDELIKLLYDTIETLIVHNHVDLFLFGSKSNFDDLCCEITSKLKIIYPHIKRIYVRAEYPVISQEYKSYLLKTYDETYFSKRLINAGSSIYVERNCEMIDKSDYCVIYYQENYTLKNNKKKWHKNCV